ESGHGSVGPGPGAQPGDDHRQRKTRRSVAGSRRHRSLPGRIGGFHMAEPLLKISNLNAYYGEVQVLHDVSLEVYPCEIGAVVGANAAGKTTLLKSISGLVRWQGDIVYGGRSLRGLKPNQIVELGIIHVPEGRGLFPSLTVLENLEIGA